MIDLSHKVCYNIIVIKKGVTIMEKVNKKFEEMIKLFIAEYNKDNGTDYQLTKEHIADIKEQVYELIDCFIDYSL